MFPAVRTTSTRLLNHNRKSPSTVSMSMLHNLGQNRRKVVVIAGLGNLGRQAAVEALQRGSKVIAVVRSPQTADDLSSKGLEIMAAGSKAMGQKSFWHNFFEKHTNGRDVTVLQTVGLATASKQTMIEANINTPVAIAEGLKLAENSLESSRFVQFSTLSADMSPDSNYGGTKLQAEQKLMDVGLKNLLNLRIGYAVPSLEEGKDFEGIDERHAYAPWQFSALPRPFRIHPVIGSGVQLIQPVHSDEIVQASLNFREGSATIMGVGSTTISQHDLARFYADLADRSFHPMYMPYEFVSPIARHFEEGYLSEHAVDALKMLESEMVLYDNSDFEKLLGKKAKTLHEIYVTKSKKPIVYTKPPIIEHGMKIVKTLKVSKEARSDLIHAIKNYGFQLIKEFFKAQKNN